MQAIENLQSLCAEAAEGGASDVFFNEGERPRLRVDGAVQMMSQAGLTSREEIEALWQACQGEEPVLESDLDAHWSSGRWRYRVNLHRHLGKLGAALRVIHTEIPTMESLHLPVSLLQKWAQRAHGLVLITGPTGCGKSTSVASILEWLNQWLEGHVVTIEEPIEYLFTSKTSLFTQREIPQDVPNYTKGLRSALRQSPDVIFMGEIRDFESARIAVQAAETGHLVFSTMHTSTVVESMERLANLMPPEERRAVLSLLACQLIGVLAQKLLPSDEGGRHLVTEYFLNEGATRDWIQDMEYARLEDYIASGQSKDCSDFRQSLLAAWRAGQITRESVLEAATNPMEMERLMRGVS